MDTIIAQSATNNFTDETFPTPSAVSWGAIFAGATAAAALSLILLILGTGLGLSTVSPWSHAGISGTTFGLTTILWVTLTSLIASALGGYIAGRLRTRWLATQADEIYFRDTAHGFLSWAVATLLTAALLTSTITSIVSGVSQAGAAIVGGAGAGAGAAATAIPTVATSVDKNKREAEPAALAYFSDYLFRKNISSTEPNSSQSTQAINPPEPGSAASKAEVTRIYLNALSSGAFPPEDVTYAGQVIAQSTGLNQQDAEKRVTDIYNLIQTKSREAETAARTAADEARKATAYGSLWLFISLLIGAFISSWTALAGGRQRDL